MEENQALQTEQPTTQPQHLPKRTLIRALFPLIVGIITFVLVMNVTNTSSSFNFLVSKEDKQYLSAAEDFICKILKNPYSATLHDSYIVEKDSYGRAIVYLDVTAENSFGGTVRNKFYVCILEVDNNGGYKHNGEFSYCEITDTGSAGDIGLTYLKEINNWGNPK